MGFYGLFIGIDRYASPEIDPLSCARRDAVALHALFTDTFGGNTTLLTDSDATRGRITDEFQRLRAVSTEDVVVITFSGHGSSSHELITYDADRQNLAETSVPLEQLTEWFSRIPARRLLCVMDCCFSGGMGSRVLRAPEQERNLVSTSDRLNALSGDGRLIVTASAATEPAWEDVRRGHGIFTFHLLEGLSGAEEVIQAGKISVLRLLEYVTKRVIAAGEVRRRPQTPAVRGQFAGDLTWPVFTHGAAFRAAFPDRFEARASSDVRSLAAFGFPDSLISAWSGAIPSLNQLQLDAINEFGLLRGEHLVVSAPTSSGKTLVGELAALNGILGRKRAFFLLPLKALVNDKHQQFVRLYGPLGIRTVMATGDASQDIAAIMRGRYDICLMTYEKFSGMMLANPHIIEQVGTVVIDEVQMLADESRGVNLEFILTMLRMARRREIEPQIVALSAVVGDTNGLETWLGARLLRRTERPVPLDEGIIRADGSLRVIASETGEEHAVSPYIRRQFLKNSSQDWVIPLVRKLVAEGKQVIVFRETRGDARGCARYLARELGLPSASEALEELPGGDPSAATQELRNALSGGVAFHISDLSPEERLVVEQGYRAPNSKIRVIAATTTLAMGINMPAAAVIVVGLQHPGNPPAPYSVAEYKNIIGRAGRLGFTERGESYLMALGTVEEHAYWNKYVLGSPENLVSKFFSRDTDPRSLILRVLTTADKSASAADDGMPVDDVVSFLESSFGAFQLQQTNPAWRWDHGSLVNAVSELLQHNLIRQNPSGGLHLTELGQLAGESGVEVRSMIRLINALSRETSTQITDPVLIAATQLTLELDKLLFPINKKSTQKEPLTWSAELQRQGVGQRLLEYLTSTAADQVASTLRNKKAVAALLWITNTPMAVIERTMTQFGISDGAAGSLRGLTSRMVDILPTTARVAELLHPGLDLSDRCARLLVRFEYGIPSAAVDLARLAQNALGRGDYLSLVQANLSSIEAVDQATDAELLNHLDQKTSKLAALRRAVEAHNKHTDAANPLPAIPLYEG